MLPVSLYIHFPWCIRKCPYCDFNSHKSPENIPEKSYIKALLQDLDKDLQQFPVRNLHSIFMGGGTPSLFSAEAFAFLLDELKQRFICPASMEITMEANPGTFEQQRFMEYRSAGINRLSLGIQSFNPVHLKTLGRIHDDKQAYTAVEIARIAGFQNINLDVMHGLPHQTCAEGLEDLNIALRFKPEHLSWYQLTIEPNTAFYKRRPVLPSEEVAESLEQQGFALLAQEGYTRYEISAFTRESHPSAHNMNYWLFGDYLGIGAGAHGKITTEHAVFRTRKHRQPKDYMDPEKSCMAECKPVSQRELVFEFMLNTTRLEQFLSFDLFEHRTKLDRKYLFPALEKAAAMGLIVIQGSGWQITDLGRRFTNDLQALFL